MRTRLVWAWVLFVSFVPLAVRLFSQASHTPPALHLDEEKLLFSPETPAHLELPLLNRTNRTAQAHLHLDLLEMDDKILGSSDQEITVLPGNHIVSIPWTIAPAEKLRSDSYWWRIKYRITDSPAGGSTLQTGIVQLGLIATQWMRMETASVYRSRPGASFPVRVRVGDRRNGKGISNVTVEAQITDNDSNSRIISAHPVKTDSQGDAELSLKLPADADPDSTVEITAHRGAASITKSLNLDLKRRPSLTLSTDKPIYQPGQTLHARVLALAQADHVAANEDARFSIEDEDGETQFEQEVQTSKFGIASVDWEIPSQIRTGHYTISVNMDEQTTRSEVRISRYELPEFTVNPVTDKTYYLPGQPVNVEVTASYLFGQPVKRGKVRIIHDNGGHWNSQTKHWESDDHELQQGELGSSGKFSSRVDLNSDFDELKNRDYERYRDVHLAAYVTDLSTNRTEQKRFTVRLSKDPIHLYAMGLSHVQNEPLDMYLTAAFPDGTPAPVDLTVSLVKPNEQGGFSHAPENVEKFLIAHLRTNDYGVAHLNTRPLAKEFLLNQSYGSAPANSYWEGRVLIEARDKHGRRAVHYEWIGLSGEAYLHIKPLKRILQAGESVLAEIESSVPDQEVFVDLLGRQRILGSRRVKLHHGRAEVEFAYDPEFRNSLYVVAYNMAPDRDQSLSAGAEVLFPEPQDLDLGVHLARTTYKPGEAALADFRVRSPDGKPMQSALGVLVYDKAVAERVRADQDFGSYGFYFWDYDWDRAITIAGISYHNLLDQKLTRPVTPEMELVAEAILSVSDDYQPWRMDFDGGSNDYELTAANVFRASMERDLSRVQDILQRNHAVTHAYPASIEEFRAVLARNGMDFDQIHDPWGMPYYLTLGINGRDAVVEIRSSGPSKHPGTQEEFVAKHLEWPFFTKTGEMIDAATADYTRSTGSYIRDLPTLRLQLEAHGINLDALRDPWQQPYTFTFEVNGPMYQINALSQGPPAPAGQRRQLLSVWQSSIHYFQRESKAIEQALAEHFRLTSQFPSSENELRLVLEGAGISVTSLRDPWGNPYRFEFSRTSRYADQVDISVYDEKRNDKLVPVTQKLAWIYIFSYGARNNPANRFEIASFSQVVAEQSSRAESPRPVSQTPLSGWSGAISGTVTDPQGAIIAGATVIATEELSGTTYTTTTNESGVYLLRNLPPGKYRLEVARQGFRSSQVRFVPVASSNVTTVDVSLNIGSASETVEVRAAAVQVETTTAQASSARTQNSVIRIEQQHQVFTPRLRKYFPETLLWRPELVTDSSGKAQIKFAMADNITSWKMSVVASNTEGQLGLAERELRTFQPFFLDHDPPKVLTEGDQIELPVLLRNYTQKSQEVEVKLEPASWFSLLSAGQQRLAVPAQDDASAHFLLSASHSVREGKERVTAANRDTGDAVEHTVAVHPDGESVTQTVAQIASGKRVSLQVLIPQNAIPGSMDAELKIYPNLAAHVLDSVQGMVARPAGCGEQITSIAFGSLLTLQVLRKAGQDDPKQPGNPNAGLAALAHKYVKDAYQQLLTLQDSNGGFPYWLHHEPNLALTAYILDFLTQASQFIDVDGSMMTRARNFIVASQAQDGSWTRVDYYGGKSVQDANLTALVARSLAAFNTVVAGKPANDQVVSKALDLLSAHITEWKDPYLIGQYALAAAQSGRAADVERARKLLTDLAHEEGSGTYWNLEANTSPFYGWGFAGRIETSGLAVQALARIAHDSHNQDDLSLVNRGLVYLLAHKDRHGVWYSTHASVNVLRAIIEAIPTTKPLSPQRASFGSQAHLEDKLWNTEESGRREEAQVIGDRPQEEQQHSQRREQKLITEVSEGTEKNRGTQRNTEENPEQRSEELIADATESGLGGPAQILVNGKAAAQLQLPAANQISGPIRADLSSFLVPGANEVTIVREQDSPLQAQVISTHYVAWKDSHASSFKPGESRVLRLNVAFDQTRSEVGKSIQCAVDAERIGFSGYGMMLAEIGLPAGADVDRSTLQNAQNNFAIYEYDVLPDRVVVYLWPRAGGSKFTFSFKPRFPMKTVNAPSILYDYYNPEAQATVSPVRFEVR